MTPDSAEVRIRDVVCGVLEEALRTWELRGLVLADVKTPEARLLTRWLRESGLHVEDPDPRLVARLHAAFDQPGPASEEDGTGGVSVSARDPAFHAAARALASTERLLLLGTETRTHLVLEATWARTLPLGDLYASEVAVWAGGISMPAPLRGRTLDTLQIVDRALRGFLDEQRALVEALAGLPDDLRRDVERALRRGVPAARPPLIPKLRRWTPGLDLAL